jgi:hypothetical protein
MAGLPLATTPLALQKASWSVAARTFVRHVAKLTFGQRAEPSRCHKLPQTIRNIGREVDPWKDRHVMCRGVCMMLQKREFVYRDQSVVIMASCSRRSRWRWEYQLNGQTFKEQAGLGNVSDQFALTAAAKAAIAEIDRRLG